MYGTYLHNVEIPEDTLKTLKPHQCDGFLWLKDHLANGSTGCILADESGLGKTRTVASFISDAYIRGNLRQVVVVASRKDMLEHWYSEFSIYRQSAFIYNDSNNPSQRKMFRDILNMGGGGRRVLLTDYSILRSELKDFESCSWDALFFDDGHVLRERNATDYFGKIKANFRVVITSVPYHNKITDLYSLFKVSNPYLFPDEAKFDEKIVKPLTDPDGPLDDIETRTKAVEVLERMRDSYQPFLMRHTKKQVPQLLSKTVVLVLMDLEPHQRFLYEKVVGYFESLKNTVISEDGVPDGIKKKKPTKDTPISAVQRLRNVCNAPELLNPSDAHKVVKSYTAEDTRRLDEMIENFIKSKDYEDGEKGRREKLKISAKLQFIDHLLENEDASIKFLIFSHSVEMLGLIEKKLARFKPAKIFGRLAYTTRRNRQKAFNRDEDSRAILISSKMSDFGGFEVLNATRVVIVDPGWDISIDDMCSDRPHSLSQTKDLIIYRLITLETVEEKMLSIYLQKRQQKDSLLISCMEDVKLQIEYNPEETEKILLRNFEPLEIWKSTKFKDRIDKCGFSLKKLLKALPEVVDLSVRGVVVPESFYHKGGSRNTTVWTHASSLKDRFNQSVVNYREHCTGHPFPRHEVKNLFNDDYCHEHPGAENARVLLHNIADPLVNYLVLLKEIDEDARELYSLKFVVPGDIKGLKEELAAVMKFEGFLKLDGEVFSTGDCLKKVLRETRRSLRSGVTLFG